MPNITAPPASAPHQPYVRDPQSPAPPEMIDAYLRDLLTYQQMQARGEAHPAQAPVLTVAKPAGAPQATAVVLLLGLLSVAALVALARILRRAGQ